MIGLGEPTPQKNIGSDFDKVQELEERIAKLEKTLGWLKWVVAFIGLFLLTNNKNNEN